MSDEKVEVYASIPIDDLKGILNAVTLLECLKELGVEKWENFDAAVKLCKERII